jgi:hypothetical protein
MYPVVAISPLPSDWAWLEDAAETRFLLRKERVPAALLAQATFVGFQCVHIQVSPATCRSTDTQTAATGVH